MFYDTVYSGYIEFMTESYLDSTDKVSKKRLYKRSNTSRIEMISDREMVRQTSKRASMIEEETRKVLFSKISLDNFVDKSRRSQESPGRRSQKKSG